MPATVHARVPLSLLDAMREVDSPDGDAETEYVQELRTRRLGMSDTVYNQIQRYGDAVKRSQPISTAEATGLSTLIGRRPDSEAIFHSAGRKIAREVYQTISGTVRGIILVLPGFLARPLALRQMRKIARRYFNGTIGRTGSFLTLTVEDSVSAAQAPKGIGCLYYESALRELLRLMVRGSGSVDHVRCILRGEGACEWRADWRLIRKADSHA